MKNQIMNTEEMTNVLIERAKELLTIPQVNNIYQSKETEKDAKDWILHQALITLIYSPKERMQMIKRKNMKSN